MFCICDENSVDNTGWEVLRQSQGLFCFSPHPTSEQAGGVQGVGQGTQPGQLTPTDQRDIPDHMASCSAYKAGGRRKRGHSELWHLPSQVTITRDGALLSWRWLNTCLPMGNSGWIPCFVLIVYVAFALPIKLPLSEPMSFLTFTLLILSLIPPGGSEWAAVCFLVASWG